MMSLDFYLKSMKRKNIFTTLCSLFLFFMFTQPIFADDDDALEPLFLKQSDLKMIQKEIESSSFDPVKVYNDGKNILFYAIQYGVPVEVLDWLLAKGVNVNHLDNEGENVLFEAIDDNNIQHINYLISKGIDVNVVNGDGETILHQMDEIPASESFNPVVDAILAVPSIQIDVQDNDGDTPLMRAVKQDNPNEYLIQKLLEKGARLDLKNQENETALDIATRKNLASIVALLQAQK